MHPVIARIHPSIRTALFAWLVSRAMILTAWSRGGGAMVLSEESGTPLWLGLQTLAELHPIAMQLAFVAIELTIPFALVAVYRFARRDTLPQGAEHATWLVAFAPAMAMLVPGSPWTAGVGLALISLGSIVSGSFWIAGIALVVAVALIPETCFVLPGLFAIGWKTRNESGVRGVWVPVAGLCGFCAVILYAVFLGDPGFFAEGLHRRTEVASILDQPVIALVLCAAFCIVVVGAYRTTTYRWLFFAPVVLTPLLFSPTSSALAISLFAAPVVATALTVVSEDLGFQRFVLMLSALGLCTLAYV